MAGLEPTSLSPLAPALSFGLIVALLGAFVFFCFTRRRSAGHRFEVDEPDVDHPPADRGTALLCWCNEAVLMDVAAQNGVDGQPVEVETRTGLGLRVRLANFRGKAEEGTRTLHRPFNDRGELLFRVLAKLDEEGMLSRTADHVSTPEIGEEKIRREVKAAHRALAEGDSSILLLEGGWEVEGEEGDLLLRRTDLRTHDHQSREPRSLPMPDGVGIHVHLDDELTRHGKNAMLGVTRPIRACLMGTVRQYEPTTGCLEIAAIAVFQRGYGGPNRRGPLPSRPCTRCFRYFRRSSP
ncbi:MAG TPA: hypothetical protein VFY04_07680 [Solirubrobacterales bacterium]|nr:hypothetical protein [Solirubrobacterales bacterium]